MTDETPKRCGYIAIVGRPNVGKSTFLNAVLGKQLSIISPKPQTTRHRLLGIKTTENTQFIFIDTPGIHSGKTHILNRYLNRSALLAIKEADIVLFLTEPFKFQDDDEKIVEKLLSFEARPVIVGVNKIDRLKNFNDLLPFMKKLAYKVPEKDIVPFSAKKKINIAKLEKCLEKYLPENPFFFEPETLTDRTEDFIAAEKIREQFFYALQQELPYAAAVSVENMQLQKNLLSISAVIFVEKDAQKKIIIGEKGQMLKRIGQKARLAMEAYFGYKIFLSLYVKVKKHWMQDKAFLKRHLI